MEPTSQEAVQTEEQEAPKPDYKQNPRYQALKEVAERAREDREKEVSEPGPTVTDDDGNTVEQESKPEQEPETSSVDVETETPVAETATPAATPAPATPAFDPNAEYEFIVDGKPMKFKGSQVIDAGTRTLQKEAAADHRLQIASQLLEEAKKTVAGVPPVKTDAQPVTTQQMQQMDDAQLAELIQFGTKEQAAEAIKYLRSQTQPVVQQMQQQLQALPAMIDARAEWQRAAAKAKEEYGDLLSDPTLAAFFFHQEDQRRQAGDKRTWSELYTDIGENMRKAFNRPKPSTAVATVKGTPSGAERTMEERKEAKRNAPAAPKLASARLESGGEQKPKSREDIIEAMRKSRGQVGLNKGA